MLQFPESALVETSPETPVRGLARIMLYLRSGAVDIRPQREAYGARLVAVRVQADVVGAPMAPPDPGGLRVELLLGESAAERADELRRWRSRPPVCRLAPTEDLVRHINLVSGLGFPVHVDTLAASPSKTALLAALEFYLRNPLLKTPVEPFHTLLGTQSRGKGPVLWDVEGEHLGRTFYVGEDGRVALSRRWHSAGLCFGSLEDDWDSITGSDVYRATADLRQRLFESASPCVFCAHYPICRGFLRAVDGSADCSTWQKAFDGFGVEIQRVRELVREHGTSHA